MLIFIRRTLEWNVFPQSNGSNFDILKSKLQELKLGRLIEKTALHYKMFDKSFVFFITFRRLKTIYSKIRNLFA